MKDKKTWLKEWRWYSIYGMFFLVVLVFVVRLYSLQVINGDFYLDKVEKQYTGKSADFFDRGNIYFLDKNNNKIAAATLQTGYKIAINPMEIKNPEDIFNNLSPLLNLDADVFSEKVMHEKDTYEELAKRVDQETTDKISDLDLAGITMSKEKWRFYPGDSLAAHVIGFLSFKENDLVARYGLEKFYNEVLEKRDINHYSNFFAELFSGIEKTVKDEKPKGDIVVTVEPSVQTFVEQEMKKTREYYSAQRIGAIVMNPNNGEIYSMAIDPTFNINDFKDVDDISVLNNALVEGVYEMGSIVKPITMAVGLDTGAVTPETTYDDKGSMTLDKRTFYNYDKKARGVVNMQTVLNNSLNTGVAFVVGRVGNEKFADYMKKILGQKTNIDLPKESEPNVKNLNSTRDIEYATASFGQGIAVTPIGMITALAPLGNGGFRVEPHLLKRYEFDLGLSKDFEFKNKERIFKQETSESITRMLVKVVDEALKGGTVSMPNYSIAAKTGTAQMVDPNNGKYYDDRYLHSFFGYFPAYDPEFLVFLYIVDPRGANYASETLTDPFMNITKFLINYYNLPPDR